MPIPNFDHNHVLPPHLGNPTEQIDLSPYSCTTLELCQHFATSPERVTILKGLISFRIRMNDYGIVHGFQWIDGSFTENVETSQGRPPNDLDLVTFVGNLTDDQINDILVNFREFVSSISSKANYKLDHYPVVYSTHPLVLIEQTRYWLQLFSHNRLGIWKGMLRVELNTPLEDQQALDYLNSI